jgi:D-psicose/D-tagatose/L-ribulose 3-epimerase
MARFRFALCNEVLRDLPFAAQCAYAAALGYDGLEVAPFTLADAPHRVPASRRAELRRAAGDAGIAIVGLHWLLLTPAGLTLNGRDEAARARTVDVLRALVDLCADLGGSVMVHGSPAQRSVAPDDDRDAAWQRARDTLALVAPTASAAGVTYCIEPLAPRDTNFINTIAEAVALVRAVGHPAVRTMLDVSAATRSERESPAALVERWLPTGFIAHVQVNDANGRGPGQGEGRFTPLLSALSRGRYAGVISVEPFDYVPDGRGSAARAIGYLRGIEESMAP